jgi:signal transduction histidine kinase
MWAARAAAVGLAGVGLASLGLLAAPGGGEDPEWWQLLGITVIVSVPIALGLILAFRRPRLSIGVCLVAFGVVPLLVAAVDAWGGTDGAGGWPGARVAAAVSAGSWMWLYLPPAVLAAVFPGGSVPAPRQRWLIYGWPVVLVAFAVAVLFDEGTYVVGGGKVVGAPPTGLPDAAATALGLAALAGLMALLIGSVTAIAVRYRRGDAVMRHQIRWLVLSAFLLPPVLLLAWISILLLHTVTVVVGIGLLVVFVAMPVGTVVGVLRHDLYDIDRLLSRTVSYTIVTAVLCSVYAVIVLVGGIVLGRGAALPVALATLACAVVFGPLRRRMQALVDRRFDRGRSRALADVVRFVDAVREGVVMPEQVEEALRGALNDPALRVAYAVGDGAGGSIWLDGAGNRVQRPEQPCYELAPGGRPVAVIGFGSPAAARCGLFRDLLREVQLPLEVARARIEVRIALAETEASRSRLVRAGDEERRRLERDLHDGAQQRLVAVGMSLRLAQRHLPGGSVHQALDGAVAELQTAVVELRQISQGLRPSGLDDGLSSALRTLVRASPVPVELRVTAVAVQDTVATTAYYVAAEAVANALKHARPRQVRIEVVHADGHLSISVTDDGRGGAVIMQGSGLAGLADRVSAGGGTLHVRSAIGRGTTVEALLPCVS